jgi:hypothetical protein
MHRYFFIWRAVAAAIAILSAASGAVAQDHGQAIAAQDGSLKMFLQRFLKDPIVGEDRTTRYVAAFADLDGHGKQEVIVYVTGWLWCGSGGCHTLVLAAEGSSYRVIADIVMTRPPVRVLTKKSRGWRGIAVWVQGGGVQPGYEAELHFDGETYRWDRSAPAVDRAEGEIAIPSIESAKPLYP